jgi:TPR repeat protein
VTKTGLIVLALVLAAVCAGDSGRDGAVAADARSTRWSVAHIMRAAERGDVRAQARLGRMYSIGSGVPQNYVLAAKWYHCAAERGHRGAEFQLGLLHNKGQGVPHDLVWAYVWLNRSAAHAAGEERDFKVRIRDAIASKMTTVEIAMAQDLSLAPRFRSLPECDYAP